MPKLQAPRQLLRLAALAVSTAWFILSLCGPAHATVVLGNGPVYRDGGTTISELLWKALLFSPGPNGARINSIAVGLNPFSFTSSLPPLPRQQQVELALFTVTNGVPDRQIATTGMVTVDIQQLRQTYTFTTGIGITLEPGALYALLMRSDTNRIKWGTAGETNTAEPVATYGFTFHGFKGSDDGGSTWVGAVGNTSNTVFLDVTILYTLVPTLSEWATVLTVLLMAAGGMWLSARRHP